MCAAQLESEGLNSPAGVRCSPAVSRRSVRTAGSEGTLEISLGYAFASPAVKRKSTFLQSALRKEYLTSILNIWKTSPFLKGINAVSL